MHEIEINRLPYPRDNLKAPEWYTPAVAKAS